MLRGTNSPWHWQDRTGTTVLKQWTPGRGSATASYNWGIVGDWSGDWDVESIENVRNQENGYANLQS